MDLFNTYLQLGFQHIADLNGYDHILFIIALCAIYRLAEWKKVAWLVTAFTLGHCTTLALAALNYIPINSALIEFLIPVTIFLTAIYNVTIHKAEDAQSGTIRFNYLFAALFGLIHGMGFSNFFRSLTMPGEENTFIQQLLSFNIGVELGQLAIVVVILAVSYVAFNLLKIRQRDWTLFVSGAAAGLSLVMALERVGG